MDSKLEKQFVEFMVSLGFPADSIVYEPHLQSAGLRRRYVPDFALVDPVSKVPLAAVEVKGNLGSLQAALDTIQGYVGSLALSGVRAYVALPSASGSGFDFFTAGSDGQPRQIPLASLISYDSLSTASLVERKEQRAEERKNVVDRFWTVCFSAAALALGVAVADFIASLYGVSVLTPERLALVGAAIALVVAPYVQRFKGLGIEVERGVRDEKA